MTAGVISNIEKKFIDLFIHVHEQQCRQLTHSLTVTNFFIIHGVRSKHMEQ